MMKHTITSKESYHQTMVAVYELMNKGEANLTEAELNKFAIMAKVAGEYEDQVLGLKPAKKPQTIAEMVEQKMYENKLNQNTLAAKFGLAQSKLSEILMASGNLMPCF